MADLPPPDNRPPGAKQRHPLRVAAIICLACLALTGLATWATARVDRNAEDRLLHGQANQAKAVLSTAISLIQEPLASSLNAQRVVPGNEGDPAAFRQSMATSVGTDKLFVAASLWRRRGTTLTRVADVGTRPASASQVIAIRPYLRRAFDATTFTAHQYTVDDQPRIAYILADRNADLVVYAERTIPADRRSPYDRDAAFADLSYAIYLGEASRANLLTTDMDPRRLPMTGSTATVSIPFGDTTLTMVAAARHHLGSTLSQRLPAYLLLAGLLITAIASRAGYQLVQGRRQAEENAGIITGLYEKIESTYGAQRELFVRLQRALLPHAIPDIPGLEVAADYAAGAQGIDIGGDWYSIIGLGNDEYGFVVGDVSGRGIDAVAVMAHARFTVRAYLLDGHTPAEALERCSYQFDITTDGHMTTAVVGVGNARTGEITLASAGHPAPLLLGDGTVEFVAVDPGRPLGTGPGRYKSTTVQLTPGATLMCFTDGLVERRHEDIDVGMRRLAGTVGPLAGDSVDGIIQHALSTLRTPDAEDDIAVLAVRWVPGS